MEFLPYCANLILSWLEFVTGGVFMKSSAVFSVSFFLLMSGCANTYTYSKGGSNEALQDDLVACKTVMARQASGDDAKDAMEACMAEKGYEKVVDKYRL